MKNPYSVLGGSESDSREELQKKYEALHAKYSEERFESGEAGNEAARKLSELESAWSIINSEPKAKKSIQDPAVYDDIDNMIKEGKINEAQDALDSIEDRSDGRWHFLQSIIYYKREWYNDSKTQLQLALNLDPDNTKYKNAMQNLSEYMALGDNANRIVATGSQDPSSQLPPSANVGNALGTCCCAYCLTDLCCRCM